MTESPTVGSMATSGLGALSGLALLRAARDAGTGLPGFGPYLGMRFAELDEGVVVFELDTRAEFANPLGTLHGGVLATMLDSAMGCAVHTTLVAGVGYTTVDLGIKYLRPGRVDGTTIRARGRVTHRGSRVAVAEGTATDHTGRVLASGTTTCLILP